MKNGIVGWEGDLDVTLLLKQLRNERNMTKGELVRRASIPVFRAARSHRRVF